MPEAPLIALFGPTAVGKTAIAIALARLLEDRGETPVAIGCDAIQLYRGLEALSGAPTGEERGALEHRLVGVAEVAEEFSAGRYAELAHREIDDLRSQRRTPILVGGTGLYLRAAVSVLELRAPVDPDLRAHVEAEVAARGPGALHAELPELHRARVRPGDRKRIARLTELLRAGIEPPTGTHQLWTQAPRVPTRLAGLTMARAALDERIDRRVEAMSAAGAGEEAKAADAAGASRTARAAIGFDEFASGDLEAVKSAHRRYARRQLTWMRKLRGARVIDVTDRAEEDVAAEIAGIPAIGEA